jgi:HK97 family phage prohead protease
METRKNRNGTIRRGINQGQLEFSGYAARFGEITNIRNEYFETILPGCFKKSIEQDDIRCLLNHSEDLILGRNRSKTLILSEDDCGLRVSIFPPVTQFTRDLAVSIGRGDINQMSFAFKVKEESWSKHSSGKKLRTLKRARLSDVSIATYPAYESTSIGLVRSRGLQESCPWPNSILNPFSEMVIANESRYVDISSYLRR